MSRWRKFKELSWSERGFLLFAIVGLAVVGIMLPVAGFERTLAWLRRSSSQVGRLGRNGEASGANGGSTATEPAAEWARRRAHLISIAARFGPYRATCLPRSLFLWWLTRRRGLDSELQIGVRRQHDQPGEHDQPSPLLAHAWIELEGEVLNDRAEIVANYAAFDARRLPSRVSWS